MGRGSLRPRDGCCSEAALGRFPPREPDLTGAKVFRECGERFVVGEKHPARKPSPLHARDGRSHRESEVQRPADTGPPFSSPRQPASLTPHLTPCPAWLPEERHVLSHVFLFLFAHSSGLPADVNLLPRGQRPHAAPGASEHKGYLTAGGWGGGALRRMRSLPGWRFFTHLRP